MGGHHKAKNWVCPDTVDTNGSSPMNNTTVPAGLLLAECGRRCICVCVCVCVCSQNNFITTTDVCFLLGSYVYIVGNLGRVRTSKSRDINGVKAIFRSVQGYKLFRRG